MLYYYQLVRLEFLKACLSLSLGERYTENQIHSGNVSTQLNANRETRTGLSQEESVKCLVCDDVCTRRR